MEKQTSLIQTIDRASAVLDAVKKTPHGIRNCDIAKAVGLPPRTVHNIVRALQVNGYLAQTANRGYVVGPAVLSLAQPIQKRFELFDQRYRTIITRLAKTTDAQIFLGFEYYGKLYCAMLSHPDGILEICGRQHWLDLLHASGSGLILIGAKGIDWFRSVAEEPLKKFTEHTIVDMNRIAERSAQIIQQGYAFLRSEHVPRLADLTVPVRNQQGKIVAGLAASFLESRLNHKDFDIHAMLEQLQDAAAKLSLCISFDPDQA